MNGFTTSSFDIIHLPPSTNLPIHLTISQNELYLSLSYHYTTYYSSYIYIHQHSSCLFYPQWHSTFDLPECSTYHPNWTFLLLSSTIFIYCLCISITTVYPSYHQQSFFQSWQTKLSNGMAVNNEYQNKTNEVLQWTSHLYWYWSKLQHQQQQIWLHHLCSFFPIYCFKRH